MQTPAYTPGETSAPPESKAPEDGLPPRLPELLAPAGDWECARAAVENGADAIYFGLDRFNARMRARNFTDSDLPELMAFLHQRGVKGYVTFNTLIFEDELAEAEACLRTLIEAGVDAAIVQDVGLCRLIRRLSPDFPIHASTQMTITSAAGVRFARALGCELVVLARECSLKEIEQIRRASALSAPLPLEVFVHGALCVAYSGQCLTSESLGGRSANRGECAQACRMPYDLIADGRQVPLGDRRYLLSPQDLAGLEVLPGLVRAGVASLKIEGRLKAPEYVANITRIYRAALDRLRDSPAGTTETDNAARPRTTPISAETRYEMEMAFSRGLYTGWLHGTNNQELVHARFGKKRGVFLGEVTRVTARGVAIRLTGPLKPGDGVVFDAGHPELKEEGGRVYKVEHRGRETWVEFGHGQIQPARIHPGDKVWKTSDPELERDLRRSFSQTTPRFQRPLSLEVFGKAGEALRLIARDESGRQVEVRSSTPLSEALTQPLTSERLREQLGRLGGGPFKLGALENHLEGAVMLPISELNRLRRQVVDELQLLRSRPVRWTLTPGSAVRPAEENSPPQNDTPSDAPDPELIVLVRTLEQLEAALETPVSTFYCELEDPKKYRQAVQTARSRFAHQPPGRTIWVAPPRVFKPGEEWILNQVRSSDADGCLVRNFDHLEYFSNWRRRGDFSLNVANSLAAEYFLTRFGLETVTASYDLNSDQLEALLRSAPPAWFEITIHQHMPMFHMEHCVFCAFLSSGKDYRDCGRPCDKHELRLRDRVGAEHPVKADAGCRNTVFNALAQTGAESVHRFLRLGARRFRIEFLNETPDQVGRTVQTYVRLLAGEITGSRLWRELKLLNQLGVTRGQMQQKEVFAS